MTTDIYVTTLGEIAKGNYPNDTYRIYVICAGDIPLYIGQSQDAIERVLSHLGVGSWIGFWGSTFDTDLTTFDEWESFTVHLQKCPQEHVKFIEDKLIHELSPVYNRLGNTRGSKKNAERWHKLHPKPSITMHR